MLYDVKGEQTITVCNLLLIKLLSMSILINSNRIIELLIQN